MDTKALVLLAAALVTAFASTVVATDRQTQAGEPATKAEKRAERAEERAERLTERAEERAEEAEKGGGEKAEQQAKVAEERAEKAEKKAERLARRAEELAESTARRDGETEGEKAVDKGRGTGETTLRIGGDPGTEFSGTCTAGGEEETIDGPVPQSFTYALGEQEKLECEIEKEAGGAMEVVLAGDGVRAVQRIGTKGGTVSLTYDGGAGVSFSSSTSG